jgi:hypothetical protein
MPKSAISSMKSHKRVVEAAGVETKVSEFSNLLMVRDS